MQSNELSKQNQMEIGNVINVLNQPKTPTLSIMDLGKQLLESAREGHTSKVHDLMCRGAPFTTDWLGKTALHMAAENNHYDTCETLLRAGISKDSRTKVERTPLHFAVFNGHEAIVELLLEHKCDVNARDMLKQTPLHWAVEEDYPNLVKLLLKHGADPYAESKAGESPITISLQRRYDDLYRLMTTYKHQTSVSMEEQQEATDSLMQEMEKDSLSSFKHNDVDISQDSTSCDESSSSTTLHKNLNNSSNQQPQNSPTLQLLQDELSVDDTNNFLQSAYACGRQIIVTEFGKQMILKVQNSNTNVNTTQTLPLNSTPGKNGDIKQKPVGIIMSNSTTTPKVITKSNIVKRITPEELTKLCGEGKVIKTVHPPNVLANGTLRFPKYRLMQKVNSDSSSVPTAVKVINKSAISNSSVGPATITTAKKMLIKSEPPQLTNFATTKSTKTNLSASLPMQTESSDTKMVQIPLPEYLELVKQVREIKELKERLAKLEEHCEKSSGFIRSRSTPQH